MAAIRRSGMEVRPRQNAFFDRGLTATNYGCPQGDGINRDPLGETGGINLYGFVYNNPLSYVDPDGMDPISLSIGSGALAEIIGGGTAGTVAGSSITAAMAPIAAGASSFAGGFFAGGFIDERFGISDWWGPRIGNSPIGRLLCLIKVDSRQKGRRMKSGDDPLSQLEEIENAQAKVRKGKSNQIIDKIDKSKQRAKNKLKEIARNPNLADDLE